MINIILIEQNKIFRESLKTVLDQIHDFKVVFDTDNFNNHENIKIILPQLILIDYSFGKTICNIIIDKALSTWPDIIFLLLTNYKEDCNIHGIKTTNFILKNSSKKEFEQLIIKLMNINTLTI